jgi:hypothetical protein
MYISKNREEEEMRGIREDKEEIGARQYEDDGDDKLERIM